MAENDDEIKIDHPVTPTIRNCFRQIVEYCGPLEERGVAAYEGYDKIQVEDDNTLSERNRSVGGKEPRFFHARSAFFL